jgi:Maltose operon periplasmic protein precursor (MalM)
MMFSRPHFKLVLVTMCCSALLAGCVTTGTQQIGVYGERLARANVVKSFGEVPALALKPDDVTTVALGVESGETNTNYTIAFGDVETSFVKVYRLPEWTSPYSLQVTSFVFGGLADPAIFYPRYALLDKDFKVSRQSQMADFVYRGSGPQGAIAATVFLNQENRTETYIAIYGEPRRSVIEQTSVMQSATNTALIIPVKGGSLMWFIATGGLELPKPMRAAAGGNLQIKMTAYKPKRIGD